MFEHLEIRMERSTPARSKRSQNSLSVSSESIQSAHSMALEHWKSKTRGTASISFLCICKSRISRKFGVQATSAATSSLITNHSQSAGGGWRLAGTEGNLSPLLYHGSTVGRPNTSQEAPVILNQNQNRNCHCCLLKLLPPHHKQQRDLLYRKKSHHVLFSFSSKKKPLMVNKEEKKKGKRRRRKREGEGRRKA